MLNVIPPLELVLTLFSALLRVISAQLLMGNLQFKQERNSDQATLPDNTGRTRGRVAAQDHSYSCLQEMGRGQVMVKLILTDNRLRHTDRQQIETC